MKSALLAVFACALTFCAPSLPAQKPATPAQLKQELKAKETAAKQDPDALFAAAQWAEEKGLTADGKRLLQAVLKLKPDHEGANKALGNELVGGKWLPAKEAEAAKKKAAEAEYRAQGMVEVDGVWVYKDDVADAKKGIFKHDGQRVSRAEKLALLGGKVRHPITGQLIAAEHLEKATKNYHPIGTENRWVDEKEADTWHSDPDRPWIVRAMNSTLVGTMPLAKMREAVKHADVAYEKLRPIFVNDPTPQNRPVIMIAATESDYREFGTRMGDETSAFGAFLAREGATAAIPYHEGFRPIVCYWEKNWGPYYVRHAVGLGVVCGFAADAGIEVPQWFQRAIGSYGSLFAYEQDAAWFAQQHQQKGGVKNLGAWFASFAINGEMESKDIDYNIFQAGLLISFIVSGRDSKLVDALKVVTDPLSHGKSKGVEKGIEKLQEALAGQQEQVQAYLQELIKKRS